MENLYNILGVSPTASGDEIRKAYRQLAMRHHPDRNDGNTARFNAIKLAYEQLSDLQKRTEYNQSLHNRIILDPEQEALLLWQALYKRCELNIDSSP